MKNKKIILVVALIIAILIAIVPVVKASDENPLIITGTGNEENNEVANTPVLNNETANTNTNTNAAENKLPQTGVVEDTTLFVFIAICIISAIYAYVKIRNYKNI